MTAPDPETCEVALDGGWQAVSLDRAQLAHPAAVKRCPVCHGRVNIQGTYTLGRRRLTLAHRRAHGGCPLIPSRYRGKPSRHPEAIG